MSEYKVCRECGDDLMWNGRSFGAMECCCNDGFCSGCCMDNEHDAAAATEEG